MDHLHPSDPAFLSMKLARLRFEIENDRLPNSEETLDIVRDKIGLDGDEASTFVKAMQRTEELEELARDIVRDALPNLFGGAFAHMADRI